MFIELKEVGEVKELDEPAKLLLKAAALIEQHGLAKWETCSKTGSMCLRGALRVAAGAKREQGYTSWQGSGATERAADARVRKSLGDTALFGDSTANWNNHPDRTPAEVVSKLRAVALGL